MLGSSDRLAVDTGQFSIKVVNGKWKNSGVFSGKVGDLVLNTEESSGINDIHHAMSSLYTKRADLYTSIPYSDVIVREVSIAAGLTDYEVEGAVEVELGESLPFSIDQVYFDYCPISNGKDNSEQKYLVAASRRDLVDPIAEKLTTFDKSSSTVKVDIDAFAYGRLLTLLYENIIDDKIVLLVDVGHQHSRFYFYDKHSLLFSREQQIGGKYVTDSIAEIYDLDLESAQLLKHRDEHDSEFSQLVVSPYVTNFAEQLNLVLDFFEASGKTDKELGKIIFTGGGCCLDNFVSELKQMIEFPVEIIDLAPIWNGEKVVDLNWEHFSAVYSLSLALLLGGDK